jgi:IclR family transcriptional regulator, acetate operon repressor
MHPQGNTPTSPSLTERIFRVIEAVVDAAEPVGPRGLARSLGIDRSAVGRILQQLGEMEVLERRPEGYVPGPRLMGLSRILAAQDTLPEAVGPVLGALVDRFDETCYVCAFHGDVAVFTHEIQSSKPLRFVVELGRPVPLYAGAAGRAILSALDADSVRALIGDGPLPRLTDSSIVDVGELLEQAAADRQRGYTGSMEERVVGGAAIAAPFFDHMGRCQGSVVFTIPISRLDENQVDEIGKAVAAAGRALSDRLVRSGRG